MIFLSVQPDQSYFLWQIRLLVSNLKRLNVRSEDIHIIFVHKKGKKLSEDVREWVEINKDATYFVYADDRKRTAYPSSVRPFILSKHFKSNPDLEKKSIFYHDSDIIFSSLDFLKELDEGDAVYASDTESYTGFSLISQQTSEETVKDMCEVIGVDFNLVRSLYMGGAQYILKNINHKFWYDLYVNCENLFSLCISRHDMKTKMEIWCTDMWCLWWMLADRKYNLRVHHSLNFYWADSEIKPNDTINIIHYTGMFNKTRDKHIFIKSNYINTSPFNADLSSISDQLASKYVVEEIARSLNTERSQKFNAKDLSILIPVRIDSQERLYNVLAVCSFLTQNLEVEIIILEADSVQKIDMRTLPRNVQHIYICDDAKVFHRTKYINQLIDLSQTPYISIYDADIILPVSQMATALEMLRQGIAFVLPFDGTCISVNYFFKKLFIKTLEIKYLTQNLSKLDIGTKRSVGGCVFLSKKEYQKAGGENENFISWGPEDIERFKRMETLGHTPIHCEGNIYHLPHPYTESKDSGVKDDIKGVYDEYFKICAMNKKTLQKYISNNFKSPETLLT